MLTVGGMVSGGGTMGFAIVIVTGADVVAFPAAYEAEAVRVIAPLASLVVSSPHWYGAVCRAETIAALTSRLTCTTPTSSVALTTTLTIPENDPQVGLVILTTGGVTSICGVTLETVNVTVWDEAVLPAAS